AFLAGDQAIDDLGLVAAIDPDGKTRLIELLSVGPDAPDAGDLTFAQRVGRVCVVAILDGLDRVALAAGGARLIEQVLPAPRLAAAGRLGGDDHLFSEARRPDELA